MTAFAPELASRGWRLRPRRLSPAVTLGAVALAVVVGSIWVAWQPAHALVVLAALALVAAMTWRVEWAVLAYVALAPFADALKSASSVSIKAVGALLVVAWAVRLLIDNRPLGLGHRALKAAAVLVMALLLATVVHDNGTGGLTVVSRYLSYVGVLVILVDVMRRRLSGWLVAEVFLWSCTAAATAGIVVYLVSGGGRAFGPMTDPNDFAFYLVCALPLALGLRRARARMRWRYDVAAVLVLLAIGLTFSRGAFVGIAGIVVYAVLTGALRVRALVAGAALVAIAAGTVAAADPALVRESLTAKQHVAQQNVDDRLVTWSLAAEMLADSPVVGQGPGGFAAGYAHYLGTRVTDPTHLTVAHEMYLDVGSELGLPGVGAFVAMMWLGFRGAWRAGRSRGPGAHLGTAVSTSFVGVALAACFLSEQYYLPVWLLVALGCALDPGHRHGPAGNPEGRY